jgi:hypothetical protein
MAPSLVATRLSERYKAVAIAHLAARQRAAARPLLQRALSYRPLSLAVGALIILSFVPTTVGSAIRRMASAARAAA